MPRRLPAAARIAALLLGGLLSLGACDRKPAAPPAPAEPAASLAQVSFAALDGWAADDHAAALGTLLRSCERLARRQPADPAGGGPWAGRVADWLPACSEATATPPDRARAFFEAAFQPYALTDRGKAEGLFTGYYEPLLEGSATPDARFSVPVHRRPPDLVNVDLGLFDPELKGRKVAGRVEAGRLLPYPARAEIGRGALDGRGVELLWVDDPVAKFFLEIQGSGQVRLRDGRVVRVGFADQNGHPYRAIGRDLVEMGALVKERVSLQAIRDWLKANPERAPEVMAKNRSYVFFRELTDLGPDAPGPPGAQGAPLTPGRSLAVDRRFVPLGAPLWLETAAPARDGSERPLRRLVVAQDTGGAIRGPVRGDLFWGAGAEAEFVAGHMQGRGRYYILLPRPLAPTS
jgi:membrane-bound lytic murein transglycosylase A